jgi:plastocyanin
MLNSYRKGAFAVAAALSFAAGAAQAESHEILIVDGSYFPNTIYAHEGDSIIFLNESDNSHTINGPEGSWTSGEILADASFSLELTHETPTTFSGIFASTGDTSGTEGEVIYDDPTGEIIFEDAPIED